MNKHVSLAPIPNPSPIQRGAVNVVDSKRNRVLLSGIPHRLGTWWEQNLNNKSDEEYARWFDNYISAHDEMLTPTIKRPFIGDACMGKCAEGVCGGCDEMREWHRQRGETV